jgi:hypothetical protein
MDVLARGFKAHELHSLNPLFVDLRFFSNCYFEWRMCGTSERREYKTVTIT